MKMKSKTKTVLILDSRSKAVLILFEFISLGGYMVRSRKRNRNCQFEWILWRRNKIFIENLLKMKTKSKTKMKLETVLILDSRSEAVFVLFEFISLEGYMVRRWSWNRNCQFEWILWRRNKIYIENLMKMKMKAKSKTKTVLILDSRSTACLLQASGLCSFRGNRD